MISLDEIDLQTCKYKVTKMTLNIPDMDEYEVNTLYISDFTISKEYDQYIYPYFNMRLTVPNQIFRAMRNHNDNVTAYVRIVYSLFDSSEVADDTKQRKEINYIADNFVIVNKDNSPTLTEDFSEIVERADVESGDLTNSTNMEIMMVKKDTLKLHTKVNNAIIVNSTLMDILTFLLNKAGAKNVLCSPPYNRDTYKQFILPPMRLDENIHHICNDYGFHKEGTTIFFDYDTVYILAKNAKCTAWRDNEYRSTKIIYNPIIEDSTVTQGVYIDSKERVNYCTMAEATVDTQSMITDQVYGGNFNVIDNRTGTITSVNTNAKYLQGSGNINRNLIINSGSTDTASALAERVNEETMMARVAIDNVLLSMLEPNKEFELLFLSGKLSKYSGKYRIVSTFTTFKKSDGNWFTPSTYACFMGSKK